MTATRQKTDLENFRHFVSISDLTPEAVRTLLDCAIAQKKLLHQDKLAHSLQGKTLAMIFQKPSLRTRLSFEVAMTQLGGHAINLEEHHIGLGRREAIPDVARVIAGMCDAIMARVFSHEDVQTLAGHSTVPVINGLSDWSHPCQAMADAMTLQEHFGNLDGKRLAFVGDGNNVARSLAMLCGKLAMEFTLAAPTGYDFAPEFVEKIMSDSPSMDFLSTNDPIKAIQDADIVYTDTWTSMGNEDEKETRKKVFKPYQINADLLAHAKPTAVVMHCLPAYRGLEITSSVLDGPQSIVFTQAENRLHFQRALLDLLIGDRQALEESPA